MCPPFHIPEFLQVVHEDDKVSVDDERQRVASLKSVEKVLAHAIEPPKSDMIFPIFATVTIGIHLLQDLNAIHVVITVSGLGDELDMLFQLH